jgi:hypothetical protein
MLSRDGRWSRSCRLLKASFKIMAVQWPHQFGWVNNRNVHTFPRHLDLTSRRKQVSEADDTVHYIHSMLKLESFGFLANQDQEPEDNPIKTKDQADGVSQLSPTTLMDSFYYHIFSDILNYDQSRSDDFSNIHTY